ncbi:MAG: protein phosphatase 2C domain-containing protein [Candidatus Magasanikbacteria bacterium]|nr:protein phosphatase 2C domain-containing protein [Candidatus Magasanikbacteria bacterium]
MFKEGLAKLFGGKPKESTGKENVGPIMVEGAEVLFEKPSVEEETTRKIDAEKKENPFSFETAEVSVEKTKGKGEDRTIVFNDGKKSIYAVLDGMGGQEGGGGDVAAQIVKESFLRDVSKIDKFPEDESELRSMLNEIVQKANKELQNSPTSAIYEKMGTTLTAVICHDKKATIVSVGDSKAYRMREGKLEQISDEDSVIYVLKKNGYDINMGILSTVMPDGSRHEITLNEAMRSAKHTASEFATEESKMASEKIVKQLLTGFGEMSLKSLRNVNTGGIAAGEKNPPYIHVRTYDVQDGDEYFVTSDGLTDNCLDQNIEQGLNKLEGKSSDVKAQELAKFGKKMQDRTVHPDANKPDDISIVYFKAQEKNKSKIAEDIEELNIEDIQEVG